MKARSVVAVLAMLALILPSVAAVHGSDRHEAGCGDGAEGSVAGQAGLTVEPGDDCGATYDGSDREVKITLTLERLRVDAGAYPTSVSDSVPSTVDLDEGIAHPLRSFISALDAAFEEVDEAAPAGSSPDVWADDHGVHLAAGGEQADVPWPRDPLTGRTLVDEERVHVPTAYRVESEDVIAFLDRGCREALDGAPCPASVLGQAPVSPPSVSAGVGIGDAGTDGMAALVSARIAGDTGPAARSTGTAPPARIDGGAAATAGAGDAETAGGPGRAAAEPAPVPSEALPMVTVATAALIALGVLAGYRRLKDGEILEHSLRHRIYDYILENPGATVQEMADTLGVDYSTADHHASVLHDFDLIHRREQGRVTYYFENHGTFDAFEKEAIPLLRNGTSSRIARVVRENPQITPSAVARKLDVDPSTVKWHVDKLQGADLMDSEPLDGRSIGLEVPETARDLVDRWA